MTLPLPGNVDHDPERQQKFDTLAMATPTPGSYPTFASQQNARLLYGSVSATGTIAAAGSGDWTTARTGGAPVGDYTITTATFTTIFPVITAVTAFSLIVATTTTTVRYITTDAAGALIDAGAVFQAMCRV